MTAAIVIPALNERPTIGAIVQEARSIVPHVVVVDDGSSDGTANAAEAVGAIVLRHESPRGVGGALRSGFQYALDLGVKSVVTIDGDGAHDPNQVASLLEVHANRNADLTIGARFSLRDLTCNGMPSSKFAANYVARAVFNFLANTDFSDVLSGMRAYDRTFLASISDQDGFSFQLDTLLIASNMKINVCEYPITVRYNALEPLATSRDELLDLLTFIRSIDPVSLQDQLDLVVTHVKSWLPVSFKCSNISVIAHPLPEINSYLFQLQDPWYERVLSHIATMEVP